MGPGQPPQFRPSAVWNELQMRRALQHLRDIDDVNNDRFGRLPSPFLGPLWEGGLEQQRWGGESAFHAAHELHSGGRHRSAAWWQVPCGYDAALWGTDPAARASAAEPSLA